jgi:molybdate transport system substrate-binding protein
MKNKNIVLIVIVIALIAIIGGSYLNGTFSGSNEEGTVEVLAGAGFSKVTPELVEAFNEKYPNIKVNVKYGGSGELFATLETQKTGDVFLPAAYKYMNESISNGYMQDDTVVNITENVPVIVVQKGNPKNITSVKDLSRSDVKVGLGEPEGPAIGKTSEKLLEKNNVTVNPVVTTTTVNQLLTYMISGEIDATIIWKDMTVWEESKDKIDVIEIPEKDNSISTIPVGITKYAKDQSASEKFQEFIISDEGKAIWEKWGFEIK